MIHSFLYVGGIGIWRPNPLTTEAESTEAHGAVHGLAKLRVPLAPDPRSSASHPYLPRFRWAFLGSEGFIQVWSVRFQDNEADAVTLDAGLVFEAGLSPYNLKPVVAEFYGSKTGKFSLGIQEGVCGPCSLLVDAESCLVQAGNGD